MAVGHTPNSWLLYPFGSLPHFLTCQQFSFSMQPLVEIYA